MRLQEVGEKDVRGDGGNSEVHIGGDAVSWIRSRDARILGGAALVAFVITVWDDYGPSIVDIADHYD